MRSEILAFLAAAFAGVAIGSTNIYRLELNDETGSTAIVGEDGVRREVVVVDPDIYCQMTGEVDKVWKQMNSTDSGRVKIHGSHKGTKFDEKTMTKTIEYADGYKYSTKIVVPTRRISVTNVSPAKVITPSITETSKRLEYLKKMAERNAKKIKHVHVEHDAATGKDVVK